MRERGLKQQGRICNEADSCVAPHAGAWIETIILILYRPLPSVAPHAGAWIETVNTPNMVAPQRSLPMRERGLKHFFWSFNWICTKSLPMRERGLKLIFLTS